MGNLKESPPKGNLAQQARFVTGLNQEEFAEKFRIPIATVRNQEQGRCEPPAGLKVYYQLILHHVDLLGKLVSSLPKR